MINLSVPEEMSNLDIFCASRVPFYYYRSLSGRENHSSPFSTATMEDPGNSTDDHQMLQQEEDVSKAPVEEELSLPEEVLDPEPLADHGGDVEQGQQQQLQQQDKDKEQTSKKEEEEKEEEKLLSLLRIKIGLAIAYSFITGWGDVLAFIHFKALTSAMTGNMVLLGAAIGGNTELTSSLQPLWFYPIVMACNVAGACVSYLLQQNTRVVLEKKNCNLWNRVTMSTTCRTAAFSLIMSLSGALVYIFTKSHLSVWLFAASFGAQNVFTVKFVGVSTAVMTGNMHKLAELIATACTKLLGRTTQKKMSREKLLTFLIPISAASATLAGSIFGGILTGVLGFKGGAAALTVAIIQQTPYVLSEVLLPS
jgi:Protein of unknown function (DUF1275)